jgi:DNA-binding MarR family transcriptional regulator
MPALTERGRLFRALVAEVFRTKILMLQGAERLARSAGLTSARWQILGLIVEGPAPVAHVARLVGLSRQSVQQLADAMEAEGLIGYEANPHHRRAKLMRPTPKARAALARLRPREIDFANAMGRRHPREALDTALALLRRTRQDLEAGIRAGEAP